MSRIWMAVGTLLLAMLKTPNIWVISHKQWVTSHIWMRERSLLVMYDPLSESKNESCHTHMHDRAQLAWYVRTILLVMSRTWMSLTHTRIGHATRMNESNQTIIEPWHTTQLKEKSQGLADSCHASAWVMPHTNASRHAYEWVMSHAWTSHATQIVYRSQGLA